MVSFPQGSVKGQHDTCSTREGQGTAYDLFQKEIFEGSSGTVSTRRFRGEHGANFIKKRLRTFQNFILGVYEKSAKNTLTSDLILVFLKPPRASLALPSDSAYLPARVPDAAGAAENSGSQDDPRLGLVTPYQGLWSARRWHTAHLSLICRPFPQYSEPLIYRLLETAKTSSPVSHNSKNNWLELFLRQGRDRSRPFCSLTPRNRKEVIISNRRCHGCRCLDDAEVDREGWEPTAVMALPEPLAKEQTIRQERGGAGGQRREGRKLTMIFQTGQCTMKLKTIRQGTPGGGPRQTKQVASSIEIEFDNTQSAVPEYKCLVSNWLS
ncbi:hypothetical protein RRG08_063354 [Elysia crispata]|uniref:Uncharacterized protein n=1 Tax=Elysia crispata TaxID=231223 RepID=A0AAE1B388_9GAST|nr:hypothetical protein RRG08_063354 [Elysia crispata]